MFRKRSQMGTFLTLAMLLVAVCSCFEILDRPPIEKRPVEKPGPVDKVGTCGWSFSTPAYEIVNNTKKTISVDHFYVIQRKDYYYPKDASIPPGSVARGELVDPTFILHSWSTNSEVDIVPTTLIAIRLNESTVAYYTGYPRFLSSELNSWIMDNQSNLALASSFYNPMPTADTMDAYGLFYILRNAGRARLGLPAGDSDSNICSIYTSLDPLNRPHDISDFVMTFTVNGPNKSDIVISYKGRPRRE